MSFLAIPKEILEKSWTIIYSDFFCQCDKHKKKYRLTKWIILFIPKMVVGFRNLKLET